MEEAGLTRVMGTTLLMFWFSEVLRVRTDLLPVEVNGFIPALPVLELRIFLLELRVEASGLVLVEEPSTVRCFEVFVPTPPSDVCCESAAASALGLVDLSASATGLAAASSFFS